MVNVNKKHLLSQKEHRDIPGNPFMTPGFDFLKGLLFGVFLLQICGQTGSKYTPLTPDLRSCSQLSGLAQSVTVEGWFSGPSTEWCVRVMRGCHVYHVFSYTYLPLIQFFHFFGIFEGNERLPYADSYCVQIDRSQKLMKDP